MTFQVDGRGRTISSQHAASHQDAIRVSNWQTRMIVIEIERNHQTVAVGTDLDDHLPVFQMDSLGPRAHHPWISAAQADQILMQPVDRPTVRRQSVR